MFHAGTSVKYGGDTDESLVTQSIRDWYDGTDDEQDTDSENECDWSGAKVHKRFSSNLLKTLIKILKPFCHSFAKNRLKYL